MKRFFTAVLSFVMLMSLCACGQKAEALTWQEQYDLGVRYLSEGKYEEAILAFTAAIEIEPKRAEPYGGRAQARVLSGETEENLTAALADYRQAVELDQTYEDGWLGMADVYVRMGDYEQAAWCVEQALQHIGETEEISTVRTYVESLLEPDPIGPRTERHDLVAGGYIIEEYDANGILVRQTQYNADESLGHYYIFEYDTTGNRVREIGYNASGAVYSDYEYDAVGNCVRNTNYIYNDDGSVNYYWVSEYDAEGNEARRTSYDGDGAMNDVMEFDAAGNCVRWILYNADGSVDYYYIFEYDAAGNQVGLTEYNTDGTLRW